MSWPINSKSKDSGGIYSKVRTFDDNDVPKALGNGGTGPNYSTGALGPTIGSKNNAYAHAHVLQALEARQAEQNSGLSMLDTSVNRLGELSLGISREIDMQNRMLDRLEEETGRAQDQANVITQHTQELVRKAGGPKTCMIITVLIFVFIFLFLLVIYT